MKTLIVNIKNDQTAFLNIDGMLTDEDYDKFWKGIDPENNDGSDGSYTENVEKIFSIYSEFTEKTDFQIWGDYQSSFADNIPADKVPALVARFREEFPKIEISFEGKYIDLLIKKVDEYLKMKVDLSNTTGDDIINELMNPNEDGQCQSIDVEPYFRLEEEIGGKEEVAKLIQTAANMGYEIWYKSIYLCN